jgi:hypothetical protein
MASDLTLPPLTLKVLFGPEGIAADENGDGYPDRLKIGIAVERGLADAGVWAQVLNLAERLAGEVKVSGPPRFTRLTLEVLLNKIAPSSRQVPCRAMSIAVESAEADKRLPDQQR